MPENGPLKRTRPRTQTHTSPRQIMARFDTDDECAPHRVMAQAYRVLYSASTVSDVVPPGVPCRRPVSSAAGLRTRSVGTSSPSPSSQSSYWDADTGAVRGGVSSLWRIWDLPRFSTRCTVAPLMVKSVGRDGSCRSLNRNVTRCRVSSAKCNRYARAMALGPSGQASGRQCRSRLRTTWADSPTRLNYVFPAGRGLTTSSPFCVNFQIPLLLTIFSMEDALPSPPPCYVRKHWADFHNWKPSMTLRMNFRDM